jgi:hypothetical protein
VFEKVFQGDSRFHSKAMWDRGNWYLCVRLSKGRKTVCRRREGSGISLTGYARLVGKWESGKVDGF